MRLKGPSGYAEWDSALKNPLTVESCAFLSRGKLEKKQSYSALFNRISDAVTRGLDTAGGQIDVNGGQITAVYCLRRYSAYIKRLFFYKKLSFIKKCDSDNLTGEIARVARSVITNVGAVYPDSADVQFELSMLERVLVKENI